MWLTMELMPMPNADSPMASKRMRCCVSLSPFLSKLPMMLPTRIIQVLNKVPIIADSFLSLLFCALIRFFVSAFPRLFDDIFCNSLFRSTNFLKNDKHSLHFSLQFAKR